MTITEYSKKWDRDSDNSFAVACYDMNNIDELQKPHTPDIADDFDCDEWGISPEEWSDAIDAALHDRICNLPVKFVGITTNDDLSEVFVTYSINDTKFTVTREYDSVWNQYEIMEDVHEIVCDDDQLRDWIHDAITHGESDDNPASNLYYQIRDTYDYNDINDFINKQRGVVR